MFGLLSKGKVLVAAAIAAAGIAGVAQTAHAERFSVGVSLPIFAAPVYAPAPVYTAAPVYVPAPVCEQPAVVYAAPVYAPAPVFYYGGYSDRWYGHDRFDRRGPVFYHSDFHGNDRR